MVPKQMAVFGILQRRSQTNTLLRKLESVGFAKSDIKILNPTVIEQPDIKRLQKTMIVHFSMIGAFIGGTLFMVLGLMEVSAGIFNLQLSVEMTVLRRAFAVLFALLFGMIFGAASGALVGIGTPQATLLRFGTYIAAGWTLLSVRVRNVDEESMANMHLESAGAGEIRLLAERQTWASVRKNQN